MSNRMKVVVVKVFAPGNKRVHRRLVLRAPAGKVWTEAGVQAHLERIGADVDRDFPGELYELVELSPREFNIVWRAARKSEEQVRAEYECARW